MLTDTTKIAILLVGGRSTRMGTDKFAMNLNGQPQWKFMVAELSKFFDEVQISCRTDQVDNFESCTMIFDELGGIGPIGAILSSFRQHPTQQHLFFVACDLPGFDVGIAEKLYSHLSEEYDVVAAFNSERGDAEPLVAFWNRSAKSTIEQCIGLGNYALFKCMDQLRTKEIEVSDSSLLRNVNSASDL